MMNIFTIDTYGDNIKNISKKEIEYFIEIKYSGKNIKTKFNENDPLFDNEYFCSKINWSNILSYHKNTLSFDFIRKHKKYVLSLFNSYYRHFTEEFLDEMWDEFKEKDNLLITLMNIKNISVTFIEKKVNSILELYSSLYVYPINFWQVIYSNLKDKNIDNIQNKLLKKIFNQKTQRYDIKFSSIINILLYI